MKLARRLAMGWLSLLPAIDVVAAQRLQGAISDSLTQRAVSGVVLLQLDASGRTLARDLSDERGRYGITLRGGATALRVQRIGFVPRTIAVALLERAPDIRMMLLPRFLEPARVVATACSARADDGIAVALLEQARTGLLTAVVSREKSPAALIRLTFERRLADDGSFQTQAVRLDSARDMTESFTSALKGKDFVSRGFMDKAADGAILHAPDGDVLLDDGFVGAYCFRLAKATRARPTQIGLAFAPAKRQRDRVDIEGTLWVDTVARELRDIEFTYLGLHPSLDQFGPGGRIGFRAMSNGMVLIDQWSLRLVGATPDTVRRPGVPSQAPPVINTVFHVSETGGELAAARWPEGHAWQASLGRLRLRATDAAGRPPVGALLRLDGTGYHARVDSAGRAEMGPLLPGPYALVAEDARLAAIGLMLETPVRFSAVRDSVHDATLTVPTAEDFLVERCKGKRYVRGDSIPWILGRVMPADGGRVAPGRLTVSREISPDAWVPINANFRVGTDGLFWICSSELDRGTEVRLEYRPNDAAPVRITRVLETNLTIVPLLIDP
jgi:hypothetical protein